MITPAVAPREVVRGALDALGEGTCWLADPGLEFMSTLDRRKGVDLIVDIPQGLPRVKGNEVLLIWALENVVKNALDALAGREGKITIYARYVGGKWVSLRIRDTGPGVPTEIRDKIFEPGVSSKSGGWGVGLALSRRIVEGVHSGRIELLETEEGTTIQIRLPAADA